MKKIRTFSALLMLVMALFVFAVPAFASGTDETAVATEAEAAAPADNNTGFKGIGAGLCVGLAAAFGALGMGIATGRSNESIARQPELKGDIRTNLIIGIVFMETAIIYALVVAIIIIFVL